MNGWVKLHRQLFENPHNRQNPAYFCIWNYIVAHANHKRGVVVVNGHPLSIERGQYFGSLVNIAEYWGIHRSTVYRIIKTLSSEHKLKHSGNRHYSIITVLNYDQYQGDETQLQHQTEHNSDIKRNTDDTSNEIQGVHIQERRKKKEEYIYTRARVRRKDEPTPITDADHY